MTQNAGRRLGEPAQLGEPEFGPPRALMAVTCLSQIVSEQRCLPSTPRHEGCMAPGRVGRDDLRLPLITFGYLKSKISKNKCANVCAGVSANREGGSTEWLRSSKNKGQRTREGSKLTSQERGGPTTLLLLDSGRRAGGSTDWESCSTKYPPAEVRLLTTEERRRLQSLPDTVRGTKNFTVSLPFEVIFSGQVGRELHE